MPNLPLSCSGRRHSTFRLNASTEWTPITFSTSSAIGAAAGQPQKSCRTGSGTGTLLKAGSEAPEPSMMNLLYSLPTGGKQRKDFRVFPLFCFPVNCGAP